MCPNKNSPSFAVTQQLRAFVIHGTSIWKQLLGRRGASLLSLGCVWWQEILSQHVMEANQKLSHLNLKRPLGMSSWKVVFQLISLNRNVTTHYNVFLNLHKCPVPCCFSLVLLLPKCTSERLSVYYGAVTCSYKEKDFQEKKTRRGEWEIYQSSTH